MNSRTQTAKPDDFIQDYLCDIWGLPADNNKSQPTRLAYEPLLYIAFQPIEKRFSLVPTLTYALKGVRRLLSQTDLMILLCHYLYLLRRPLSPKVRQTILDTAENLIEDLHAGFWINQLSGKEGDQ